MTPPPADLGNFAAGSLGENSCLTPFIHGSLNRGSDGISGSQGTDAVHNFTDKLPDGGRLVFVGIDAGYSAPFVFLSIHELTYERA